MVNYPFQQIDELDAKDSHNHYRLLIESGYDAKQALKRSGALDAGPFAYAYAVDESRGKFIHLGASVVSNSSQFQRNKCG